MYDADGFLIDNDLDRYALGSLDQLSYNADESLDIYIQAENPGGERENNWLPAPKHGAFTLTARLYWPKRSVLKGRWQMPGVRKEDSSSRQS